MASLRTGDGERLTRQKFRELLDRPWYAALLLVVPCALLVYAAYRGSVAWAIAGPLAAIAITLLIGHSWAAGQARRQVLMTFASLRGMSFDDDPVTPAWTPLLRAGDERRMDLALSGTVDGMPLYVGHFTYTEIRHTTDSKGNRRTERTDYDFTVAATEVDAAAGALPTLYLKPDEGLFDWGDGWLSTGDMTKCETESVRFNERYKAWHRENQDPLVLRRFLDPSTVDALANHPLHFGVELSGGRLLVYIESHCADSGELSALVDALAMLRRCLLEAARVSEPGPASPAPPAASFPPPA